MIPHGFKLADGVVSRFLRVESGEVVPAGIVVAKDLTPVAQDAEV